MEGFLDAIRGDQGATVVVGGVPVFVARARLGLHFQLDRLATRFDEAPGATEKADLVREYLSLAMVGLSASLAAHRPLLGKTSLSACDGIEAIEAFITLRHLNRWQWVLPWIDPERNAGADKGTAPAYTYKDRWLAGWVHALASRYGWERDTILSLWPEEAAAYIQEIEVSEYHEHEDRRALSEISYRYDKSTKVGRFIPTPMPLWMVDNKPPASIRVPVGLLPVGNVIRAGDQ